MEHKPCVFRFGDVEVQERELRLTRHGEALAIEPKAFRLLVYLVRHAGRLIPKEELLDAVWSDTAVTENSLTRAIALLRRLLEDDAHHPRYIETVTTAGYRWVCMVEVIEEPSPPPNPMQEPRATTIASTKDTGRRKRSLWLLSSAAVVLFGVTATGWYIVQRPLPPPRISKYVRLTYDGQGKIIAAIDETRMYLHQPWPQRIAEMSVHGGEIVPHPVPIKDPWILSLSPDGSRLIVTSEDDDKFWLVGTLDNSLRLLTTHKDMGDIVWSPDGKSLAYSTFDGDIYRVRSDWTQPQKLSAAEGAMRGRRAHDLTWSPDGKSIRFTRDYQIWEISSQGSIPRPVLPDWNPSAYLCCGRWTPDGAFFLFLSGDSLMRSSWMIPAGQLWAVDERNGLLGRPQPRPVPLTSGPLRWELPFPSKDGSQIFARGAIARGELVRVEQQTHSLQPFLNGMSAEYVAFTKDGKSVAYVTYPEGILWRANSDGSEKVQMTDPPMYPKNPRWSPDGSQIVFVDNVKGKSMVYIVSASGGQPQRVQLQQNVSMSDPNWSADGSKIIFATCDCIEAISPNTPFLQILDLKTHKAIRVPGSQGLWSPRWSPDGRFILAMQRGSGPPKIYSFKSNSWSEIQFEGKPDWPSWSRDSRFIYFLKTAGPEILRYSMVTGKTEKVTDLVGMRTVGWVGSWMGLDPNDNPLVLRNETAEDIYALTLERK